MQSKGNKSRAASNSKSGSDVAAAKRARSSRIASAATCVVEGLESRRLFAAVGFGKSTLVGTSETHPTSLQFGPDGRLYVAEQDGVIKAYTVQRNAPNAYSVTNTQVINLIDSIPNHDDTGAVNSSVTTRQVTGILVAGTAASPVIYVSSSDPRIGGYAAGTNTGLDTNSGVISRLTLSGAVWSKQDLVRGLPRSESNHSTNGMQLDSATNTLYVAQAGNTNEGAPSNNFAFLPEYALSGAILTVNLNAIGNTTYDIPTLNDDNGNASDPFGGDFGKNQAKIVSGGPVQIYMPGFRNPYDLVLTTSGRIYTTENGPNSGWGGVPFGTGGNATNQVSEGGSQLNDSLIRVTQGGYGGHPNPTRANANNKFNTVNPQSPIITANPQEGTFLTPGQGAGTNNALANFNASTDGISEYTASNFGGAMKGDLLTTGFANQVSDIKLNAAGTAVVSNTALFSSVGSIPLDVTAVGDTGLFPGTIWTCDYSTGQIDAFEPTDYTPPAGGGNPPPSGSLIPPPVTGADNAALDEDGDGYDNHDEILNGTNPGSAASIPHDWNHNYISDKQDPNDDNDAIPDTRDPFAIDTNNGYTSSLPVFRTFNSGSGGLLGMGFTGAMSDGTTDYNNLFNSADFTAGGAAHLLTLNNVPSGDALGSANTQKDALQFGINVNQNSGPFTAHTRIQQPFSGSTAQAGQSIGFYIGNGNQDNYFKLVVSGDNGGSVEALKEVGGTATAGASASINLNIDAVDLYLKVNPANLTVQPQYSLIVNGVVGAIQNLGSPVAIPAGWLNAVDTATNTPTAMAVGIIATAGSGPTFAATWSFLNVVPDSAGTLGISLPTDEYGVPNTSVRFDGVGAGNTITQMINLVNEGGIGAPSITISNPVITGAGAAAYSAFFQGAKTLAPGQSTIIAVNFSPTGAGTQLASLSLSSTASNTPIVLPLTGVANNANSASATFSVTPTGTIAGANTSTPGAFAITNTSQDGVHISKVVVDASTALLPHLLFDPSGTAGDTGGKVFSDDSSTADGIGGHLYTGVIGNGFQALQFNFNTDTSGGAAAFAPGQTVSFSADIDPNSIQGSSAPGPNQAGNVSGLELAGSTIIVYFDDGTVRTGYLYLTPGSTTGSQVSLVPTAIPATPVISLNGIATTPATVSSASQTVHVTGPAGASVKVLVTEAGQFLVGVPAGGPAVGPYDANSIIGVTEYSAAIGGSGAVDVPVTLKNTNISGGYNYITAVVTGQNGTTSQTATKLIARFVPAGTSTPFLGTPTPIPGQIEFENFDNGGEGVAYHDLDTANQGGATYRAGEGVDIQATPDAGGGYQIAYAQAGEWLKYTVNVNTTGTYSFDLRVSQKAAGGQLHLEIDGQPLGSTINIPNTGSWSTFQTITVPNLSLSAGTHVLRVVMDANANDNPGTNLNFVGNLNWMKFNLTQATPQGPTVSAGSNQTVNQPFPATLSGSVTETNPPGALTSTWTKISGPGTVTFANANSAATTATFSATGSYVLQLAGSDGTKTNTATVTVTVNPDPGPVVSAGVNQTITLPATASLSGSVTQSPLPPGATLTSTWSLTSGPGTVTFGNASALSTTASFSTAGTFVLKLSGSNGTTTNTASVTVTVNPAPAPGPVVSAGSNQTVNQPFAATLSGSVTEANPPGPLTATWSQISGPGTTTFANANSAATTATFSATGSYVLQLAGSDGSFTNTASVTVTVNADPGPSVNAGGNKSITLPATASLSGSVTQSPLPPGATLTSTWSLVSGPGTATFANANSATTTASFSIAGTYVVQLAGSDGTVTNTSTATITVNPVSTYSGTPFPGPGAAAIPGTIQAENFDNGGEGVAYHDLDTANQGGVNYRPGQGVDIQATSDTGGGNQIAYTQAGEWLKYTVGVATSGTYNLDVRLANRSPGGQFHLEVDGVNVSGTVSAPNTGAWTTYQTLTVPLSGTLSAGTHVLRLAMDTNSSNGFVANINWFRLNLTQAAPNGPTVSAGSNQSVNQPFAATLSGSVTETNPPGALTSTWSQVSGPGTTTFANANSATTTATFSAIGSYVLKLTGSDGTTTNSAQVTVTVNPDPGPVVNAGSNQTITLPATASLNGSVTQSPLPPGATLTSTWSLSSGPGTVTFGNANATSTTASFSTAGTYVLKLTGSDGITANNASVTITVNPAPAPGPVVTAGSNQTVNQPFAATLNGSVTETNPPGALTATWTKFSGPGTVTFANASSAATTATFSAVGSYVLQLAGSDGSFTNTATATVTVNADPGPVVGAGTNQTITLPASLSLNGSVTQSPLPPGATLASTWSVTSGPGTVTFGNSNSAVTTASFSTAGSYILKLTGSDGTTANTASVAITVNPASTYTGTPFPGPSAAAIPGTIFADNFDNGGEGVAYHWQTTTNPANGNYRPGTGVGIQTNTDTGTGNTNNGFNVGYVVAGDWLKFTTNVASTSSYSLDLRVAQKAAGGLMHVEVDGTNVTGTISIPNGGAWNAWQTVTISNINLTAGSHVVRVAFDTNASDSFVTNLSWLKFNQTGVSGSGPTVSAGTNAQITLPATTVQLNGSVTESPLPPGGTLTSTWSTISGPAAVTFANANSPSTTATFSTAGTYVLQLAGSDGTKTNTSQVTITVNPAGPTTITWNSIAPIAGIRLEAMDASVNGKYYVFGGFINSGIPLTAGTEVDVYDPATNIWTHKTDMPFPLTHAAMEVQGQYVYICGGEEGNPTGTVTGHVWRYDTVNNSFLALPDLPLVRAAGGCGIVGHTLYFFGGLVQGFQVDGNGESWSLDLNNTGAGWTPIANMPNPRNHMADAVLNGKVYAIGGQHNRDETNGNQSEVDAYDPTTNTWTQVASLPQPIGHESGSSFAFVAQNRIVVVAGEGGGATALSTIYDYNPATDKWLVAGSTPVPRKAPVADIVNGQIIFGTGSPDGGFTATGAFWISNIVTLP